jgi:large subunit ribosomal protein L10
MAKTRQQKESEISEFVAGLKGAKTTVFADISKLKVQSVSAFRRGAKKEAVSVSVAKKTLLRRALSEAGVTAVDVDALKGSVAMLFANGDEVSGAKLLEALRKENESVKVLGGLLEGKWMTSEQVVALAKLPTKEQLLGQLVGTLAAPITGFMNVLSGNTRGLVNVLNAIKEAKA